MRRKRALVAILLVIIAVVLSATYYFFDPAEVKWMPRCIWKVATATDCPGCGSQRMAHALMHGDIAGAWNSNAYALCMLPIIGALLLVEFFREKYPVLYRRMHSPVVIWALAASVFVWWIGRNLV
ncbi:MAG: DUF2752 domain-containing protein [Muribaculaceae bacterium]|nr:DUF2752 domain-containing protein [Muribaculaceae bacterium]